MLRNTTAIFAVLLLTACPSAGGGTSNDSQTPQDPPISTAPAAPTELQASDGTYISFIRLTWNPAYGAEGYEVYWSDSASGTYEAFDTCTATSYDDYAGGGGATYFFKIKAYNQYGYSDFSNYDSGWAIDLCNGSWEPPEGYSSITNGSWFNNVFMPMSPGYVSYRGWMQRGYTYRIVITNFYYPDNADLYLYSSYGDILERSNSGSGGMDEVIYYTAQDTGYYFVRVVNWLGSDFTFSIGFSRL
jgi:hypothetical protein